MASPRIISDFAPKKHNHRRCVNEALKTAEAVCTSRSVLLTDLRRRILGVVWSRHGPIRAYDILRILNEEKGDRATPNTVYRALEFLIGAGLIHRLESLNAFMGCADPNAKHTGHFLICRSCESAAEIHDASIDRTLRKDSQYLGFSMDAPMIEVRGLCPACAST